MLEPDSIEMMTDAERADASLVKNRKDYQTSDISVYFGSSKKELEEVCLTCKKKDECVQYLDTKYKEQILRREAYNPQIEISQADREKISNNVFIIVKCNYKEE